MPAVTVAVIDHAMKPFHSLSTVEQFAAHLRAEIEAGRLSGTMPGVARLVKEQGVGTRTVVEAMAELEREGLIENRGARRRSRILGPGNGHARSLRVRILLYDREGRSEDYQVELRHQLEEAGHDAVFAEKNLQDLGMHAGRVARFVRQTPADAWVVVSASREVLEWFVHQPVPVFALFGRSEQMNIAATRPGKSTAMADLVGRLVELGHRRIAMMSRAERRKPTPGFIEQVFLDELKARGLPTSSFNLPDWSDDRDGFHKGLDALFRVTPPTALLLDRPTLFMAAQQHLALRGITAPRHVSLISMDPDPIFAWCDPPVSHVAYDSRPWVRRVLRWVANVSHGRNDRRNTETPAHFIEGGTIGPAPRS